MITQAFKLKELNYKDNQTLFRQLYKVIHSHLSLKEQTAYTHPDLDQDVTHGIMFLNALKCDEPIGYWYNNSSNRGGYAIDPKYRGLGLARTILRSRCLELYKNNITSFVVCFMGDNEISRHCLLKYLNDSFDGISVKITYDDLATKDAQKFWDGYYYNVTIQKA